MLGFGDLSIQVKEARVTPNLFDLLVSQPMLGRPFALMAQQRNPIDSTEIIVSHKFWQRALGGDSSVIDGQPRQLRVKVNDLQRGTAVRSRSWVAVPKRP